MNYKVVNRRALHPCGAEAVPMCRFPLCRCSSIDGQWRKVREAERVELRI